MAAAAKSRSVDGSGIPSTVGTGFGAHLDQLPVGSAVQCTWRGARRQQATLTRRGHIVGPLSASAPRLPWEERPLLECRAPHGRRPYRPRHLSF